MFVFNAEGATTLIFVLDLLNVLVLKVTASMAPEEKNKEIKECHSKA